MNNLSKGFIEGHYEEEEEPTKSQWIKFIKWVNKLISTQK